ncbi:MAG: 1-(5-phosphoribosyl)-5-amino-4-imidazole-carboxylate carboxylase, partial [Abditibacteriota bacterium]|nr:1-(5-phosphoribosyl)-5-amino-4-imidazole-carboxylate carboxylase [Abditibacteriota bacterium]
MDIREILEGVKSGALTVEEAESALKTAPFADLGYAKVDTHRRIRQGAAEVVYGAGKTAEQISGIVKALTESGAESVLVTRLDEEKASSIEGLVYNPES